MTDLNISIVHTDNSIKCEQLAIVIDVNEFKSFECGCQVGYHLNMSNFQQCEGTYCGLWLGMCI